MDTNDRGTENAQPKRVRSRTDAEMGARIGYHYSSISRLLSGDRDTSMHMFEQLVTEYMLDANEALEARKRGPHVLASYLIRECFEPGSRRDPHAPATPRRDPLAHSSYRSRDSR